ncbi:MAG: hypothetical protein OEZ02_09420, partial [Anaerolineae bacterium]|nr:hypothetical protein [Anaerolineae bacterium]
MSPKWLKRIWIFTALITLALVFATRQVINLSASSSTFSIGQTVYVVGSKKLTLLRDTASSSSRVAAIVEFGTLATVRDHKG